MSTMGLHMVLVVLVASMSGLSSSLLGHLRVIKTGGSDNNASTIESRDKLDYEGINCTTDGINLPTVAQADALVNYFDSTFRQGCVCTTTRDQTHYTAVTLDGVEANIWRTKANPAVLSSTFNCTVIADSIRTLIDACSPYNNNGQVGGMLTLSNCLENQDQLVWEGNEEPYLDGGAALEIRQVGQPSPWHAN
ncbi:hypothetical protein BDV96DRAFT_642228 [Lophiotrema nucula]|uniref:Ecp2 effector protein domain-containing protein n=1 Tax=Lophiotrema nucula TaxID=690887 RepID=A0A6A5ZQ96_9PLEO|nr:hypothetical protein BDV96DRAFT_642228 [Lophiotrema nucula]